MRVETERLVLRTLELRDLEAMVELWTDRDVARFMDDFGPRTDDEVREWLPAAIGAHDADPRYRGCAIVLKATDEVVGYIGFNDDDFAYIISRAHRGQGLASEALTEVITYGFDVLHAPSLWGQCHVDNAASARVMERAGLTFIGEVGGQRRYRVTRRRAPLTTVLGAPGSGKTTIVGALRAALPVHAILDWDTFIPAANALAGRDVRTSRELWDPYRDLVTSVVYQLADVPTVVLGVSTPDELPGWPDAQWILLDCDDDVRRQRLAGRPQDIEGAIADARAYRGLGLPAVDSSHRTTDAIAHDLAGLIAPATPAAG